MTGRVGGVTTLLSVLALASTAGNALAQDNCAFSPAFQQVRGSLGSLSTIAATKALQSFAEKPQSPELCEATALDEALGEREKQLVTLVDEAGNGSPAHAVFRCNVFIAKTAQCQSPNEDGTAHPNLAGALVPLKIEKTRIFEVKSELPDAKLHAIYLTTLAKALDGKQATRLTARSRIKGSALAPTTVLIAIYKTQGANKAWAYRKAVWYF